MALNNEMPQGLSSSAFAQERAEGEVFVSAAGSDCGIVNVNIGTSGCGYMRRGTSTINYSGELPLAHGVDFSVCRMLGGSAHFILVRAHGRHGLTGAGDMLAYMKRTTVKIPDSLDARLRHEARLRGTTISEINREALEIYLGRPSGRRALGAAAAGRSGRSDISERIEEILAAEAVR